MNKDQVCNALKELQVRRKFVIKVEIKVTNSLTGLAARMCGFDPDASETEREKVWGRAKGIVHKAVHGKAQTEEDEPVARAIAPELGMIHDALIPIQTRRDEIEKSMKETASQLLPAESEVMRTPGFAAIGLAVIIGEAGNLDNYATERKLWRRLGYGMAIGHEASAYSTWRRKGGLTAEEWETAGYSPRRLAQIYGVVTVPLVMHKSKSKYGDIYAARRARTLVTHPEWYADKNGKPKLNAKGEPSSAHGNMDAARVMTKAFLADLWQEWRRSVPFVDARDSMAGATNPVTVDP